eukprot:g15450.t1
MSERPPLPPSGLLQLVESSIAEAARYLLFRVVFFDAVLQQESVAGLSRRKFDQCKYELSNIFSRFYVSARNVKVPFHDVVRKMLFELQEKELPVPPELCCFLPDEAAREAARASASAAAVLAEEADIAEVEPTSKGLVVPPSSGRAQAPDMQLSEETTATPATTHDSSSTVFIASQQQQQSAAAPLVSRREQAQRIQKLAAVLQNEQGMFRPPRGFNRLPSGRPHPIQAQSILQLVQCFKPGVVEKSMGRKKTVSGSTGSAGRAGRGEGKGKRKEKANADERTAAAPSASMPSSPALAAAHGPQTTTNAVSEGPQPLGQETRQLSTKSSLALSSKNSSKNSYSPSTSKEPSSAPETPEAVLMRLSRWRVRRAGELISSSRRGSLPRVHPESDSDSSDANKRGENKSAGSPKVPQLHPGNGSGKICRGDQPASGTSGPAGVEPAAGKTASRSPPSSPGPRVRLLSEDCSPKGSLKRPRHGSVPGLMADGSGSDGGLLPPPQSVRLLSDDVSVENRNPDRAYNFPHAEIKRRSHSGSDAAGVLASSSKDGRGQTPGTMKNDKSQQRLAARVRQALALLGTLCERVEVVKKQKPLVSYQLSAACRNHQGLANLKLSLSKEKYEALLQTCAQNINGMIQAPLLVSADHFLLITAFAYLVASGSLYWGFGPAVYQYVRQNLNGQIEAYASPFNHTLRSYCSPFSLDRLFGSLGSLYDVDWASEIKRLTGSAMKITEAAKKSAEADPEAGCSSPAAKRLKPICHQTESSKSAAEQGGNRSFFTVIANPPYIESEIQLCAETITKIFSAYEKLPKTFETPLVLSINPDWRPAECLAKLSEIPQKTYERVLEAKEHGYYNYQTCEFVKAQFPSLAFAFQGGGDHGVGGAEETKKILEKLFTHMGEDPAKR